MIMIPDVEGLAAFGGAVKDIQLSFLRQDIASKVTLKPRSGKVNGTSIRRTRLSGQGSVRQLIQLVAFEVVGQDWTNKRGTFGS